MYEALRKGATINEIHELHEDQGLLHRADAGAGRGGEQASSPTPTRTRQDAAAMRCSNRPKKTASADRYLSQLLDIPEEDIREARIALGITEAWEGVHVSCTQDSAYYYSTYNAPDHSPSDRRAEGHDPGRRPQPHRPGHRIRLLLRACGSIALKKLGFETIIVNCNPETVSTDYDTSDKLYFEPLTTEDVLSIYEKEKPLGVIAQFGGQTPLNLAAELKAAGVNILGTSPEIIDLAEDRDRFRAMMDELGIPMPESDMAVTVDDALAIAHRIGYPVMVRPSYVLGGRGMEVVYDDENLISYMNAAVGVTPDRPILVDRFLNHALECEADAICDGEERLHPSCHGAHRACRHSLWRFGLRPAFREHLTKSTWLPSAITPSSIAEAMHVRGLMNMQYAIENDVVYVLEANPRASRTVPLVSKICNIQMVPIATEVITMPLTGRPSPIPELKEKSYEYYGVKEAVLPFNMFPEVDPVLGPEMRSTGEVLGLAKTFGEAFFKAQEATQTVLPKGGKVLVTVSNKDKDELPELAHALKDAGFDIYATEGSAELIEAEGIAVERVKKLHEGRPNLVDLITNGEMDLVINTPAATGESAEDDSYIRKTAIKAHTPYFTTMAAALASAKGIKTVETSEEGSIASLQEIHAKIS